jgi:PEP-CTERM motif
LAFITGLTFVKDGPFTGTMTPITAQVTLVLEPSTFDLVVLGLAGFGLLLRRREVNSALRVRFTSDPVPN